MRACSPAVLESCSPAVLRVRGLTVLRVACHPCYVHCLLVPICCLTVGPRKDPTTTSGPYSLRSWVQPSQPARNQPASQPPASQQPARQPASSQPANQQPQVSQSAVGGPAAGAVSPHIYIYIYILESSGRASRGLDSSLPLITALTRSAVC